MARQARATFWTPRPWNRSRFDERERQGGVDVMEKAHAEVERILAEHDPRPLTAEQEQEMDAIPEEARAALAPT